MKDNSKSSISYVLNLMGKIKKNIIFLSLIEVFCSIISTVIALLLKYIVDAITGNNRDDFYFFVFVILGIVLINLILRFIERRLLEISKSTLENNLKRNLFKQILNREYSEISNIHTGEWMNRLTSDTKIVSDSAVEIIPSFLGTILRLLGCIILLIILAPKLSLLIIPGGIVLFLVSFLFRKKLKTLHKDIQEKDGDLRIFMTESLENLMVIHSYQKEEMILSKLDSYMDEHKKSRIRRMDHSNIAMSGFSLVMRGFYLLSVVIMGEELLSLSVSFGTFTAILELISMIQNPFISLSSYLPRYYSLLSSTERLREVEKKKEMEEKEDMDIDETYQTFKSIKAENLTFEYDDHVVLDNLSFEIRKKEITVITGESGAGKTTLFRLFLSFLKPSGGRLLITDERGENALNAKFRSLFAYVPQSTEMMSGKIKDIVSFNDENIDLERLDESLRIAEAYDFVYQKEDGIDTMIKEHQSGISRGEAERLLIARAIYSKRPILLLDEITASLDSISEEKVLKNIKTLTDKTIIIITHRQKALEIADNIIHIEKIDR